MTKQRKCPLCKKGKLKLVNGNRLRVAWLLVILFRPIRLLVIISGHFNKMYKCDLCRKRFFKGSIECLDRN